jgi:hypothetical protein
MDALEDDAGTGSLETDDLFRKLAYFSLLSGAARLIPVPLIDDWALDSVRRWMFANLLERAGLRADRADLKLLVQGHQFPWYQRGCLHLLLFPVKAALWLLGKLFRKILFFMAVKAAADQAVAVFCEGYLIAHLTRTRWLTTARLADSRFLRWVHWAVSATLDEADPRFLRTAMRRVFRRNRQELDAAVVDLEQVGRRHGAPDQEESEAERELAQEPSWLSRTVDAVVGVFASEPQFLKRLEGMIEARLPNSGFTGPEDADQADRLTN